MGIASLNPSYGLYHAGQDAGIELAEPFASLEETVLAMIELVRALPPDLRRIWERLDFRRLNVGIQAAGEPHAAEFAISAEAIGMMAALHLEIVFTVYGSTVVARGSPWCDEPPAGSSSVS